MTAVAAPWAEPAWWALGIGSVGLVYQFSLPPSVGAALFLLVWGAYLTANLVWALRAASSVLVPWLFPAWACLSILWTQDALITGRAAIQLVITVAIGLIAAQKLDIRNFVSALMLSECTGAAGSLISGNTAAVGLTNTTALIGIYASKNEQAQHDGVLIILATAVLLDRKQPLLLRIAAGVAIPAALAIVWQARSVATVLPLGFALIIELLLVASQSIPKSTRSILFAGSALIGALTIGVGLLAAPPFSEILQVLGKNATLTGRTILWDSARQYVSERPVFGVGYYDFWVQSNPEPEYLWNAEKIISRAGLTFQNTFWHYAVELGLVGAFLMMFTILSAFALVLAFAVKRPSIYPAAFLAYFLFTIQRTYLEVDFGFPFTVATIALAGVWIYVRQGRLAPANPTRTLAGSMPSLAQASAP
jgi:exopolysaccharide production protein ExoQ